MKFGTMNLYFCIEEENKEMSLGQLTSEHPPAVNTNGKFVIFCGHLFSSINLNKF